MPAAWPTSLLFYPPLDPFSLSHQMKPFLISWLHQNNYICILNFNPSRPLSDLSYASVSHLFLLYFNTDNKNKIF